MPPFLAGCPIMIDIADNPLLQSWNAPFGLPPFDRIRPEHFAPAFLHAMGAHRAEIDAIAGCPEPPTFDNTLVALDRGGRELQRISQVFFNLAASASDRRWQVCSEAALSVPERKAMR